MTEVNIKKVALVGGGVIGGGWATRCLANGLEVVLTDPRPEARDYVETMVADAWPVLKDAGLISENKGELHFAQDIAEAVQDADFRYMKRSASISARMWSSHQAPPGFCRADCRRDVRIRSA